MIKILEVITKKWERSKNRNSAHSLFVLLFVFLTSLFFRVECFAAELQSIEINGVYLPKATDIKPFKLTANNGNSFTQENLKGHWTMLFFGFTNCGYVCPTTLSALNNMYKLLEKELPANQMPSVVMVSVDPTRDTVAKMNNYVHSFNAHFIGARADEVATIQMEKQFHIAATKMEADNGKVGEYTINHTADIILVNPEGKVQAYLSFPHKPEQMVKDYKSLLTSGVKS